MLAMNGQMMRLPPMKKPPHSRLIISIISSITVNITCAKDKRNKAVEIWNRMVAGDKAIPENYDRLARLLGTREFRTDAIAASRKAVALAPGEYRYREALARRLMENKEYAAALSRIRR